MTLMVNGNGHPKSELTPLLTTTAARLCRVEKLLRSRQVVTTEDLMRATGASRATLKRDLTCLREELGAPVIFDHVQGGYRLTNVWQGIVPTLLQAAEAA